MRKPHSQRGFCFALSLSFLIPLSAAGPASARLIDAIGDMDANTDHALLPAKLSGTGLYDNVASKDRKVTDGIIPFKVNVPLWSDGAHKQRWVQVPAGTKIIPTDTLNYVFPDKTVFIKNFAIDTIFGDTLSSILIETRFLVVRKNPGDGSPTTVGFTYKWRRDQLDADLVDFGGLDTLHQVQMSKTDKTKLAGKRWRYPAGFDCDACHSVRGVLGFNTPQLNDGKQLKALAAAGLLSADPLAGKTNTFRWRSFDDKTAGVTLEHKVRSWFGANCSHCHSDGSDFQACNHSFDYYRSPGNDIRDSSNYGYYVNKPSSDNMYSRLVAPGHPESSFVMRRITYRDTMEVDYSKGIAWNQGFTSMPPLATFQLDSTAVKSIQEWICSLKPGSGCAMPPVEPDRYYWDWNWRPFTVSAIRPNPHGLVTRSGFRAFFRGGELFVAGGRAGKAQLFDGSGRRVPLTRVAEGQYRLGYVPRAGAYFLRVGMDVAKLSYLP
jgi:hypothetical protein